MNEALTHWRQGDCVLGEQWFVFRMAPDAPLTEEAVTAAANGVESAEGAVSGFAVLSQTCDIVRNCGERPFIEVCPLVEVDESILDEIERGRRPNYAHIRGVSDLRLVADLDRVMTVEKTVVAQWNRVAGCRDDHDARRLSLTLARKRARFAFPDDFVSFVGPLKNRLSTKHGKGNDEGRALRALREIRIRATPSWDSGSIQLMFWFIRHESQATFGGRTWDILLEDWLRRVPASGRFAEVQGMVLTLDDLTAREYVESDPMDLDHLSSCRE
ncbi:MAG: hypothetical protein EPO25_10325 [Gammaproteobacteria bacterium]|nr:MAG: hypothetical protein EPO25_10325 [Gammaproteobacteria bacterium]